MSIRKATIARIPTTTPNKFIDVFVSYNKGGISYATYRNIPRGYSLHVQPIEVKENFVSFMGFSGYRQDVEDAKRFSQKTLEAVAERMDGSELMQQMIDLVCEKQNLTLEETPATTA